MWKQSRKDFNLGVVDAFFLAGRTDSPQPRSPSVSCSPLQFGNFLFHPQAKHPIAQRRSSLRKGREIIDDHAELDRILTPSLEIIFLARK